MVNRVTISDRLRQKSSFQLFVKQWFYEELDINSTRWD